MTEYKDMFGKTLEVGMDVLYTTNSRDSGLSYGRIVDIYEGTGYYTNLKVKVAPLKDDGELKTELDIHYHKDSGGNYIRDGDGNTVRTITDTGKPVRPSILDYSPSKFYVL